MQKLFRQQRIHILMRYLQQQTSCATELTENMKMSLFGLEKKIISLVNEAFA